MPPHADTMDAPHALYRLFTKDGTLLYIGCSAVPFRRVQHHLYQQPWNFEIARIELEWMPDWLAGRQAEMRAIELEHPRHNALVHAAASVGTSHLGGPPRRDGLSCPKCGNPKKDRRHAYCPPCNAVYQRERRIEAGWTPHVPEPPTCPRCDGPRPAGKSYCAPCKSAVNKERREKIKKAAIPIYP